MVQWLGHPPIHWGSGLRILSVVTGGKNRKPDSRLWVCGSVHCFSGSLLAQVYGVSACLGPCV
ncbi:hypothetical protein QJS04_geneDACA002639 [Acorus gramineus]|uniref:Uncharacterized protein n=1 Tax=Acorus gramineus TaxID=55184 RepID=A0AAV9AND6_ACOGR|nr:hypothetical protein QJS04_geneDACA002639 [Acorus gramineus]